MNIIEHIPLWHSGVSFGYMTKSGFLGFQVDIFPIILEPPDGFPEWIYHFEIQTTLWRSVFFLYSFPSDEFLILGILISVL